MVCAPPLLASRLWMNMGTQQFTDGSQLIDYEPQGTEVIQNISKIQEPGFSKPFQVQSQLNTSSVNENLVPQEAFKPSQVIPE